MPRQTLSIAIVLGIVGIAVVYLVVRSLAGPAGVVPLSPRALSVTLPEGHDFVEAAIAPDGTTLVYAAIAHGRTQLFARPLSTFTVEPLAGTQGATQPFFSPDGMRVGFFADGFLRWVALDGSRPVDVVPVPGETAGASWGAGDQIVFAQLGGHGLQRVSAEHEADGTLPVVVDLTTLDEDASEIAHGWPHVLADGRSMIFTVSRSDLDPRLAWLSLESGERQLLEPVDGPAFHVDSGHLIYARQGEIFARPVDAEDMTVTGPERLVASGAAANSVGYNRLGQSSLVATRTGLLLYAPASDPSPANVLTWVDHDGESHPVDGVPARHQAPRVSPDGGQIAVAVTTGNFTRDLWILDLASGVRRQITREAGDNHSPLWTEDSRRITFASNREGPQRVYRVDSSGGERVETLLFGDGRTPGSWSPAERNLFFHERQAERGRDIWVWTPDSDESSLLLGSTANERSPTISPDGRWLAYVSDTRDGDQVYIRHYPGTAEVRVSPTGGTEPVWAPDGSELYYRRGRNLVAAAITADSGQAEAPRHVFAGAFVNDPGGNVAAYDISPDGSRFLMLQPVSRTGTLSVIEHWQDAVFGNSQRSKEP